MLFDVKNKFVINMDNIQTIKNLLSEQVLDENVPIFKSIIMKNGSVQLLMKFDEFLAKTTQCLQIIESSMTS